VTGVTAWYIRHGHNLANQRHQLSHKVTDYPLTDLGVTQSTTLAGQLARQPGPVAIYASPLRRAAQTAEIIAAHTSCDVISVEGLRELDVGDLDGRSDEGAWAVYHQVLADWGTGGHDSAFPGGEDYSQMTARPAARQPCPDRRARRHHQGGHPRPVPRHPCARQRPAQLRHRRAGTSPGTGRRRQYPQTLAAHLVIAGCPLLDGAQDSDGGGLARYLGIRWGMTGEAAGGVFVVGGTWAMGVGRVRRLEVTMQ
jgi:hypothetical protein